jgi:hypothetical protein
MSGHQSLPPCPGCFNIKSFPGENKKLFLNNSASAMDPDKSHDFYGRKHFLPDINPIGVFQMYHGVSQLKVGILGASWFCPRSQFSLSPVVVFISMFSQVKLSQMD